MDAVVDSRLMYDIRLCTERMEFGYSVLVCNIWHMKVQDYALDSKILVARAKTTSAE